MNLDRDKILEKLKSFSKIGKLKEETILKLLKYSRIVTYRKEKALYYQDEPSENVFFILDGKVRKVRWKENGSSSIIEKLYSGNWLGLAEVIANKPYLSDCLTEEDTELFYN